MKTAAKSRAIDKIYKRRDRYEIPDWQRGEVWSTAKKQDLIDSILRAWYLPKFYLLKVSGDPEEFEVVDGQQRLTAIFEFMDNELALTPSMAKKYGGRHYEELSEANSDAFDDFEIQYDEITDATEEEIKQFFQRLQQGLPLTGSEKLNAVHSSLQKFCKEMVATPFFTSRISLADKRHSHFDIASKVAAIEIDGLKTGLRFDDLSATFVKEKGFSNRSDRAKQLKSTIKYLERAFPDRTPELRNRTLIQSVMTLASKIVATGKSDQTEATFAAFVKRFHNELAAQLELGLHATDKDYSAFQRSINANVRGGASDRHNILLRKMFSQEPSLAALFGPQQVQESGLNIEAKRLADDIRSLIETVNTHHASTSGKDLIKATNKTAAAIGRLGVPIKNVADYEKMVSDLYFLFWEGPGERLKGKEPQSFKDINILRTDLQHDVDHGKSSKSAAKRKLAAETFQKYSSALNPSTAAPEIFPIFQATILAAIEKDLRQMLGK